MMNYMRSEQYRLVRKKGLYVLLAICLGLFAFHAYISIRIYQMETDFHRHIYYGMLLAMSGLAAPFISIAFSRLLTGKDNAVLKQEVAFGVSRSSVFFTKFALTLLVFSAVYGAIVFLGNFFGNGWLPAEGSRSSVFLVSAGNMLPVIISAFALSYVLNLFGVGSGLISLIILGTYFLSGDIVHFMFSLQPAGDPISKFLPSSLLETAMESSSFSLFCWGMGTLFTVLYLAVGLQMFKGKDIK